jgi:hypothetical protein
MVAKIQRRRHDFKSAKLLIRSIKIISIHLLITSGEFLHHIACRVSTFMVLFSQSHSFDFQSCK